MCVVTEARHDVPMQMRHPVAKRGEIDLDGADELSQRPLDSKHDAHEVRTVRRAQICHFSRVKAPNHTAKPRMVAVVGQDDPAAPVGP